MAASSQMSRRALLRTGAIVLVGAPGLSLLAACAPAAPAAKPAGPEGGATAFPDGPLPNVQIVICPVCREPRAEGASFCEECGHNYAEDVPAEAAAERPGLSGPLLWAFMLFWVALAIGGLFFLYNALWAI